jgi:Skp family chaperone for outer membrane proteins
MKKTTLLAAAVLTAATGLAQAATDKTVHTDRDRTVVQHDNDTTAASSGESLTDKTKRALHNMGQKLRNAGHKVAGATHKDKDKTVAESHNSANNTDRPTKTARSHDNDTRAMGAGRADRTDRDDVRK